MLDKANIKLFYKLAFIFIAANSILIANEFYYLSLLPVVIIVAGLYFVSIDKVIMLIVFFTPLSLTLQNKDFNLGLSLPTEPLMIGVMLMFFLKLIFEKNYDKSITRHPITIAIIVNLVWMGITSITSTMPLVSIKFLISRLWFVTTFYFVAIQIFKNHERIKSFLWCYIVPMAGIAAYTIIRHSQYLFNEETAHWVMEPFFNDHTSYGAILAMFYPALIGFTGNKHTSNTTRFISLLFFLFFTLAIILSYTRAAWISLIAAFGLYILMLFKVKARTLFTIAGVAIALIVFFQKDLMMNLEKNNQDSSDNLEEHVQSISNVSSDASNLERINRWNCAIRMFQEKPILGWGPGTYMFKYAPFQLSSLKTLISTNDADRGNAHSEYFGPMSESGILGIASFFAIVITVVSTAMRLYYTLKNGELRMLVLVIFLGMVTYLIHGFLNNFLDTDKASVPFWGFAAMIAAIDIYHNKEQKKEETPALMK